MKTLVGTYENLQIERNSITTILQKVFHTHKLFFVNILPLPTHLWAWNYESILKILLLESIKKNFTQTVKHRSMQENPLPPSRRSSPPHIKISLFIYNSFHKWKMAIFTSFHTEFLLLWDTSKFARKLHPDSPSPHPCRNFYRHLCHEKWSL